MMIIVGLPILYRQINELIRSIPDLIAYIQSLDFSFLEIFPLDEIISWLVREGGRYLEMCIRDRVRAFQEQVEIRSLPI